MVSIVNTSYVGVSYHYMSHAHLVCGFLAHGQLLPCPKCNGTILKEAVADPIWVQSTIATRYSVYCLFCNGQQQVVYGRYNQQ